MSTGDRALVLVLVFGEFAIIAFFVVVCWKQQGQIERLKARHLRRAGTGPSAVPDEPLAVGRPGRADTQPVPVVQTALLADPEPERPWDAGTTRETQHASATWEASEPYLPERPRGEHPYPPLSRWRNGRADTPVVPVETGGHPPWTGEMPVYGGACTADVLEAERLNRAMQA